MFYLYLIFLIIIIFWLCLSFLWFLRSRLQDDAVPVIDNFTGEKVMFIFPHPDDEITCAGTIKMLNFQENETILLTLTKGEAGPTNNLIDESDPDKKVKLGKLRQQELQAVSQLLGIHHLEILDFPDSGIKNISSEIIKNTLKEKINHYQPTILVTYDDRIGFYGHPDHVLIARYLTEIFRQEGDKPGFSVKKLYQVTLPKPMIEVALKISDNFRRNYPTLVEQRLPQPTIAVKITPYGTYKRDAMLLHRSQRVFFDEMQPYFDKVAPFIYFRIFDKEYFVEVK